MQSYYDRWDRPVLSQDGEQRLGNQWAYVKYDIHNRPVITGVITTATSREGLTSAVANSSTRDEIRNGSSTGYTMNRTYPVSPGEASILTITYYDNYTFRTNTGWSNNNGVYAFSPEPGYPDQPDLNGVKGLVTGHKSRNFGPGSPQWIYSVTYYDQEYRPLQQVTRHPIGGTTRSTYKVSYAGETEKTLDRYTYTWGTTLVEKRFTYDHAGRPLRVYHRVDSEPEVLLAHYAYNELGQVMEVTHHSRNEGGTWLYRALPSHTIQGWTDEIRYLYANNNQVFRQKLDYNKNSGTSNDTRVDGLITANQWKHYGSEPERAYNYDYDTPKRLTAATYRQKSGSLWTENNLYTENNIGYSANGNIQTLNRYREKAGSAARIDQLAYNYTGNHLFSVTDNAPSAHKADGFLDGNPSGDDYAYNANGFLTMDLNKGITGVSYNLLDLPEEVNLSDDRELRYFYGPSGNLLIAQYLVPGEDTRVRRYVGDLVFEGNELTEIRHGWGRVLTEGQHRYQYNLTDHPETSSGQALGSTRVVLQEDPANFAVMATFEPEGLEEESIQFMDYDSGTRIASELFDHTGTGETGYALRLSDGMTGPARSVSVLPGDTVRIGPSVKKQSGRTERKELVP
ncbi:RHS repeat domain-containing protein [Pleomorphovibrio marinus]|uniref:hypothetical protein n=1 Tax=Pleomorphovibrio marinus TaxID=2164132 RepID=UPI000E0A0C6B|nr:hypothetical protein [Pleomorphovibrio marinus]